jgi:hypothetical protein
MGVSEKGRPRAIVGPVLRDDRKPVPLQHLCCGPLFTKGAGLRDNDRGTFGRSHIGNAALTRVSDDDVSTAYL